MRRSTNLLPAAWLCIATASIGGRASAAPVQVLIHNGYTADVLVTVTDLNTANGVLVANEQPVDASADFPVKATLDNDGVYHLHWKVQDTGRTKSQEGDCQGSPVFTCRVDLVLAP